MDRHWFPAILIGLTLALAIVFVAALSPRGHEFFEHNPDVRSVTAPTATVDNDTYQTAVTTLLDTYASTHDAKATYNALIALRVPRDMQNVHYELVIAMGKQMAGEYADATARFAALKAEYPWLNL